MQYWRYRSLEAAPAKLPLDTFRYRSDGQANVLVGGLAGHEREFVLHVFFKARGFNLEFVGSGRQEA